MGRRELCNSFPAHSTSYQPPTVLEDRIRHTGNVGSLSSSFLRPLCPMALLNWRNLEGGTSSGNPEYPAPPDRFRQSSATTSLPDASQLDALDFSVALSRVVRAMMIARQAQAAVRAWLREGVSQGFVVHEMSHGTNRRRAQTTLEVYKRGRDRLACTGALAVQTRPESS